MFMQQICRDVYAYAKGKVDLLRCESWTPLERSLGQQIASFHGALTEEQLKDFEAVLREVQFNMLGGLFALIDGTRQPPGWPGKIRLVNMDTGEEICPQGLEWALAEAMLEYREQQNGESEVFSGNTTRL